MKFHFEQLEYQQHAAKSVVGVFANCEFAPNQLSPSLGNPVCDYAQTEASVRAIRKANGVDNQGEVFSQRRGEALNLDVVMETGTGKTFTFIDTIYRLSKEYGLSKFVILVPSNAIRAGALKNLEITREFFGDYNKGLSAYDYNETNAAKFIGASNKKINVLVASFASFNRVSNKINKKKLERNLLGGAHTYMDAIAALRPVIIIDEPHRAEGEKTQRHLPNFKAQIILRYGATFKGEFRNLMYAMDSANAFRKGLVKSITVSSVSLTADDTLEYRRKGGGVIVYTSTVNGNSTSQTLPVRAGDNLGAIFKTDTLNSYIVEKPGVRGVLFDNGYYLPANTPDSCSELREEARGAIMRKTIQKHFAKERDLFARGIKALSLFFIDDVGAYLTDGNADGELAKTFDALYAEELQKVLADGDLSDNYREYLQKARGREVRGGYFAKSNKDKDNEAEINLILRNKEQLLSFGEPTRFIFSKWALREGWDNPNIFTLAKLAPSNSEITKLQQIGRGLRLPVNQEGRRSTEERSVLDVIVPGDEEGFVRGIQQDINNASLGAGANLFSNLRLIKCGVCPDQMSANRIIDGLAKMKLLEFDRNYNATVISGQEEYEAAKTQIAELAREEEADADKLLKFLADLYQMQSIVRVEKRHFESAKIRKDKFAEFKDAWRRINSEAMITYDINTPELIETAAAAINARLNVRGVRVVVNEIQMAQFAEDMIRREPEDYSGGPIGVSATFGEFMRQLSAMTKLTSGTLAAILGKINAEKFDTIANNPKQAARDIARVCTQAAHSLVMQTIGYNIIETRVKATPLNDGKGEPLETIKTHKLGRHLLNIADIKNAAARDKFLYGKFAGYDSAIEKTTIEESGVDTITVFAKLPKVGIRTPVGEYNPDFAFVVSGDKGKQLYLVVETKGYDDLDMDGRERERQKIECAQRFFKALNEFSGADVNINFRTKLNNENLADIIAEIRGG